MADFATLVLVADTRGLKAGVETLDDVAVAGGKAEKATDKAGGAFKTTGVLADGARTRMIGLARSLGIAAAGFVSIAGVTALVSRGAADIDAVAKSARRLEASITGYRAIEMAAGEAGVSIETLVDSVQTMDREISKGSKAATDAMGKLGISAKDLSGLDVDQKMALIADRVQELGLTTGQASAVLQEFGIRNREMILGIMAGGDMYRSARADIESYGLALSSIQSDEIEAANDAIGRLGLIGQYAAQQLSLAFTPALGAMAQAMTDSLREGGLLRGVIDGLVAVVSRLPAYLSAGAAILTAVYAPALVAASVAAGRFVAALVLTRAALIRTGIGIAVVAIGELVYRIDKAAQKVGGFGKLMGLLGNVASEVWQRIGDGASYITNSVAAMSANIQVNFISAIRGMAGVWVEFTWTVADGLNSLFGSNLQGASAVITQELGRMEVAASDAAASALAAADAAAVGFSAPLKSVAALNAAMAGTAAGAEDGASSVDGLNDALGETGGKAGKAAKALKNALTEAEAFNKTMKDAVMTAEDFGKAKAEVLIGGIEGVSNAFGDFVSGGLKDFKGFAKSIVDSFKGMLSQMIAMAVKNKIMIGMGFAGSGIGAVGAAAGVAGGAAGAAAGVGAAVSGGAGLLAGISGIGSAFMSGATGLLTGGLGGVTTAMGAATGALGSFAAAAGAIAVPLLAVGAVFSFFKGKTKELDGGLRVTVAGMESLIETFKTTEKSRFWGLSKKTSTNYAAAEDAVADPVTKLLTSLQTGIMATAASLKIGGDAFKGFNKVLTISTKGLTNDQIMEELQKQIASLGDSFAGMVPALKSVQRDGEGAMDALNRIATSLAAVNPVMRDLGLQTYQVGVKGAAAASKLVDLYGGLQGFADATTYYFENFYSLGRQSRIVARQFSEAVGALNINKVPQTAKEFKALVDRLNDAGKSAKAAGLIQLAPLFDKMKGLQESIDKTGAAAEKAAAKLDKQAAIADQRASLERKLLELQGDTAALRKLDLAALYRSNRGLQRQIWAQEKANDAAEKAAEILKAASDKAAEAAQAAMDKAASVIDQRLGLEGKLLELQGNTAELRRRELAALDPTNRALQQMIWGLEDAKSAMDALDPNNFATKFEFLKAQAMTRSGVTPISTASPSYSVSAGAKPQDSGNVIELRAVVAEIRAFREEQRQLGLASSTDNRKTANVLRKWDSDGMPAERT